MIRTTYNAAMRPVTDHFGGLISEGVGSVVEGILPFANGAPFSQGKVMPFAQGGVVTSATAFPMLGGTGLMGEAGPEAIMPLARGADGKLGVRGNGGGDHHRDEHHHARCAGVSAQPKPDCRSTKPRS